jgi:hypothetical protein
MKRYLIFLFFLFASTAQASIGEFFGANFSSSSLANQIALHNKDASNSYLNAAILAHERSVQLSSSVFLIRSEFNDIQNIVIKNNTNSSGARVLGSANTNAKTIKMTSLGALLPLPGESSGVVSLQVFTPIGSFAEMNSGDSFLPEYVMYRSRFDRTSAHLQYAKPLGEYWSFSLGTQLGFQVGSDVGTQASLNGAPYGSSSNLKAKVKPTLGLMASVAYADQRRHLYLSYQQEMKTNLEARASGKINNPTSGLFSIALESMVYYDPHQIRFSWAQKLGESFNLHLGGDYQIWSGYKPPTIIIRDLGGILLPSTQYERVNIKNIFIPKIGLSFKAHPQFTFSLGAFYRPTPLDSDFSGAGNSIDTDVLALTAGPSTQFDLFGLHIDTGVAIQYHKLKNKQVTKTPGQENGSAGDKIGAPGYTIGGQSMAVILGFNISL